MSDMGLKTTLEYMQSFDSVFIVAFYYPSMELITSDE